MSKRKVTTIAREMVRVGMNGHECKRTKGAVFIRVRVRDKAYNDAYSNIRAGLATSQFPLLGETRRARAAESKT